MSEIHLTPEQEEVLRYIKAAGGTIGIYRMRSDLKHAFSHGFIGSTTDYFHTCGLIHQRFEHQIDPDTNHGAHAHLFTLSPKGEAYLHLIDSERDTHQRKERQRQEDAQQDERRRQDELRISRRDQVGLVVLGILLSLAVQIVLKAFGIQL